MWKGLLVHSPWGHSLKNLSSLKPSLKNHLLPLARLHQKLTNGFTSVRSLLAFMVRFVFSQVREAVTINLCFSLLSVVSFLGWGQSADVTLELVIQYLDSFYQEQSRVVGGTSGPRHHSVTSSGLLLSSVGYLFTVGCSSLGDFGFPLPMCDHTRLSALSL